jgi:hypothetical protein
MIEFIKRCAAYYGIYRRQYPLGPVAALNRAVPLARALS